MYNLRERRRHFLLRTFGFILPVVTLAATSGVFGVLAAQAKTPQKQEEVFPHMDPALSLLKQAQSELQKGGSEFGGHRESALQHVSTALGDVQSAIDSYMKDHPTAVRNTVPLEPVPAKPGDPYPHMDNALRLLQKTQAHLNAAEHLYHGKREDALNHVNAAIAEIQKGEEYYRAHPPAAPAASRAPKK
jgi:hypothetical protein